MIIFLHITYYRAPKCKTFFITIFDVFVSQQGHVTTHTTGLICINLIFKNVQMLLLPTIYQLQPQPLYMQLKTIFSVI